MSESDPSDSIEERIGGSRRRILLVLRVNRWHLTAAVLVGIFGLLVAGSQLGLTPLRQITANQDGLEFLFSAFIGAIITGTSIVVTINQLVLSQELGAVGKQRSRMQGSIEFRKDVESEIGEGVSPPEPAAFLYKLVDGAKMRATRLQEAVGADHDEALVDAVDSYVDNLTQNAESVMETLEDAQFGTFSVIWAALNFNYSWKIYAARQLRYDHGEALSEEASNALEEMIDLLELFGPAREHFKTLYFQWELINLSRALLYISVPALVVMGMLIMYVDANAMYGTTLGIDNLVWLTSAGFTVGVAPFVVFTVFVVRIATVAKRTLAMGPFILRETKREGEYE